MTTTHPARQAEPGQSFTWNGSGGVVEFTADDKGVVRPADDTEEAACVAFGLALAKAPTKPAPAGKETV
jgi:hypothetical protein